MRKLIRTLLAGIGALLTLITLSACSEQTATEPASTPSAAFPKSARYVADMTAADGKTMTIGISVEGAEVAAYACNGTDDEAWFFGNQTDGAIDITSRFRDTLTARFDGTNVVGDVTMNGVAYEFSAAPVSGVAGMYTAAVDGVRASWVVREDGTAIGVQFDPATGQKLEQADLAQLADDQFRAQVRNKRQLSAAKQIEFLANKSAKSTINGKPVTPTLVTGTFRLG